MISKFHIKNFKSLRDVSVELDQLTVFVGKSGSGKTNFVEAIRFLRDLVSGGEEFVSSLNQPGKWEALLSKNSTNPDRIGIECWFTVDEFNSAFHYKIEIGKPSNGQVSVFHESLTVSGKSVFALQRVVEKGAAKYAWIGETNPASNVGKIKPPMIASMPQVENAVIALVSLSGIGCYDFPGSVLQTPGRKFLGPLDSRLDDNGANYLGILQNLVITLSDLTIRRQMVGLLKKIVPTVSSIELNDLKAPDRILVNHDFGQGAAATFSIAQESEGLRRFYAHLLALYQVPKKQMLAFEEPEKGIYPGALEVLAKEFKKCADSGRSQILLTTHSPSLLDHLPVENIRVVEIASNSTAIRKLAHEQFEAVKADLMTTGELLTVDPARGYVSG